jgi:hypothetical protein
MSAIGPNRQFAAAQQEVGKPDGRRSRAEPPFSTRTRLSPPSIAALRKTHSALMLAASDKTRFGEREL